MLVYLSTWEKIRDQFTTAEKQEINRAANGESICPRGLFFPEDGGGMPDELRTRFFTAVRSIQGA